MTASKRPWPSLPKFNEQLRSSGQLDARRAEQAVHWLWNETTESLLAELRSSPEVAQLAQALEDQVRKGDAVPTAAARQLVQAFLNNRREASS